METKTPSPPGMGTKRVHKPWDEGLARVPGCMFKRFRPTRTPEQQEELERQERAFHRRLMEIRHAKRRLKHDGNDDLAGHGLVIKYTAEDDRRLAQEMAHTDKILDDVPDDPPPPPPPCLRELAEVEEDEEEDQSRPGRVSAARIRRLRALMKTRYHPFSERFLREPFCGQADADEIREANRLGSKFHAALQAQAAAALEEYDAKGYLDCNADGTIRISKKRAETEALGDA
ncbi:hypothetical protein ACP70R_028073 [Stipagrostis hirtigluma subsp. patula]